MTPAGVRLADDLGDLEPATSWLRLNTDLLRPGMRALDVACGSGRHAIRLAAAGLKVTAIDRDERRLESLRERALRLGVPVTIESRDLEQPWTDLGDGLFDLVVVVHYLHRPLFPALAHALAPGGFLIYETFTEAQASRGHPTNRAFLLRPGELRRLVQPLAVLREREGVFEARDVASIVAVRTVRDGRDLTGDHS
jgi:2-polyprenyl-3-methyl-5-hydroxy-6-metoxy-1,4-benzoquinol methylase